jgi:RHS repeat-associated protein
MDAQGNTVLDLMDYHARMYASYLNQFTQPDSIIPQTYDPQSWNRYEYAEDNPINHTDPTGHDPYWCDDQSASSSCYGEYSGNNIESSSSNTDKNTLPNLKIPIGSTEDPIKISTPLGEASVSFDVSITLGNAGLPGSPIGFSFGSNRSIRSQSASGISHSVV